MDRVAELIATLRGTATLPARNSFPAPKVVQLGREAAEALEAAQARIAELEQQLAAARVAALEEAACKAEFYDFGPERTERDNARNSISRIIATAIRALAQQEAVMSDSRKPTDTTTDDNRLSSETSHG
jgi:hypothetical protein